MYGISAVNASGYEIFDLEFSPYTKVNSYTTSGGIVTVTTSFDIGETTYIRAGVPSETYSRALTTFYKPLPRGSGSVNISYTDPFIYVIGGLDLSGTIDPPDNYLDLEYIYCVPSVVVGDPNTGNGINIYNSAEEVIFTTNIESYVTIELATVIEVTSLSDLPVVIPAPRDLIGKIFYYPEIAVKFYPSGELNYTTLRADLKIDYDNNELTVQWNRDTTGGYMSGQPNPFYIPVFIGSIAE